MTQLPDYYERTAAEARRRTGIAIDVDMARRTEEVTGKPFGETTPDGFARVSAVVQAEAEVYRASQEQAIGWFYTVREARKRRGAETVGDLAWMIRVATDPEACSDLSALQSLTWFPRGETA